MEHLPEKCKPEKPYSSMSSKEKRRYLASLVEPGIGVRETLASLGLIIPSLTVFKDDDNDLNFIFELKGELAPTDKYGCTFRFTLYDKDGDIRATDTTSVSFSSYTGQIILHTYKSLGSLPISHLGKILLTLE